MAEDEGGQNKQGDQAGFDSDAGGEKPEQQNKISGLEVGLMTILLGVVPDAVEFGLVFLLLDDFWVSDIVFFTASETYAAIKGVDGRIYSRMGNIAELVPYVGSLPLRTVGWSAAFYAHNHPNSWLGKKIAKIGETFKKIEKGVGVATTLKGKGAGGSSQEGSLSGASTARADIARSGTAKAGVIEERNRVATESFNKSNEELTSGRKGSPGEGGSINPESMSAMSDLPKMETHGFPNKKDQAGDDDRAESSAPARRTSGVDKKMGSTGKDAPGGVEDFDMGNRPPRAGGPQTYSPGLPDKPSWAYDQKAERAGQQLKRDVEYAKMMGGDVNEVFNNYYKNQFVNADSLRNRSGDVIMPPPPGPGKENENVVELNGKQVDLRKAA